MTDWILALLPSYGPWILGLVTFLSCLALPVPASLVMIAAGAFAAAGDLSVMLSGLGAWTGAVLGDQVGFALGRRGGGHLHRHAAGRPKLGRALQQARDFAIRRGTMGVFLSRWLVSPLGPYVNLIGGAAGLTWIGFTTAGIAGEAVWVTIYTGAGYAFSDRMTDIAAVMGNLSGFLAAAVVAAILGRHLFRPRHRGAAIRPGSGGG